MCWWFLYHIRLKVRQTELHFSFFFFFPEWYFCSKDSVGIIVLRLWDCLCWYLLWVLSGGHPSTLLSWEVGTALPDFQLPVHVPFLSVSPWHEGRTSVGQAPCSVSSPSQGSGKASLLFHTLWVWRLGGWASDTPGSCLSCPIPSQVIRCREHLHG